MGGGESYANDDDHVHDSIRPSRQPRSAQKQNKSRWLPEVREDSEEADHVVEFHLVQVESNPLRQKRRQFSRRVTRQQQRLADRCDVTHTQLPPACNELLTEQPEQQIPARNKYTLSQTLSQR